MPMTESKMNIDPPTTTAQIRTTRLFDLELFLTPCAGTEAGDGAFDVLDSGGVEIIIGGFAGTGEGEGVRKLLEGDGEGESDDGDGEGEFEDGESDGGIAAENGDKDGETDMEGEALPVALAFPFFDGSGSSTTSCNLR